MKKIQRLAVFGGGSWGTALACHVATVMGKVTLYVREQETVDEINNKNKNSKYLGDINLHKGIVATNNIQDIKDSNVIIIAVPSYAFSRILEELSTIGISAKTIFLIATKGISSDPVGLFSDKIKSVLPNPFAFISGPNFAKEVARHEFTSVTISSEDLSLAKQLADLLRYDKFEIGVSDDIITIQIAGIVKNIVAIRSGMISASGAGENARAWLVTKGLQEIAIISKALGGRLETILEPAVVGDLILTGYSATSRNTKFGYEFHKNNYSKEFLENYPILVEGVEAARLIHKLIGKYNLDLPVISSIVSLVN